MDEIGGLNGTVCYCHGENCNSGDVLTSSTKTTKTTPPSPSDKQKCLRCLSGEDCFSKDSDDGESVECVAPTNTGCYKISTGDKILLAYLDFGNIFISIWLQNMMANQAFKGIVQRFQRDQLKMNAKWVTLVGCMVHSAIVMVKIATLGMYILLQQKQLLKPPHHHPT